MSSIEKQRALFYSQYHGVSQKILSVYLINACKEKDINKVNYLLTSPELKIHADIHFRDDQALMSSYNYNNYDITKFLLTSDKLKEKANINCRNGSLLLKACIRDDLYFMDYLLTSKELSINIEMTEAVLNTACMLGHLKIVKYILTSPKLKDYSYIKEPNNDLIKLTREKGHLEILQCLLFPSEIDNYSKTNTKRSKL